MIADKFRDDLRRALAERHGITEEAVVAEVANAVERTVQTMFDSVWANFTRAIALSGSEDGRHVDFQRLQINLDAMLDGIKSELNTAEDWQIQGAKEDQQRQRNLEREAKKYDA